jgi:Domain of unknown function (DUF1338)
VATLSKRKADWEAVLAGLTGRYERGAPDMGRVLAAMREERLIGSRGEIENDHIAFRTFGVPNHGIASLEPIFLHYGYERRDRYVFAAKRSTAFWYSPPSPEYPRIFLSELRVEELSPENQRLIAAFVDEPASTSIDSLDLDDSAAVDAFLQRPFRRVPTVAEYELLAQESEYASWTLMHRHALNHFTIGVHGLPDGFNTLLAFNAFLVRHGLLLNDAGGVIKQSADGLLLQSSTVATLIEAEFVDGIRLIPGAYLEFAERRVLPQFAHLPQKEITRACLRDGFEAENADKIFESTYSSQTRARIA